MLKKPPHQTAEGGLNFHSIFCSTAKFYKLSKIIDFNFEDAFTRFLLLIVEGLPLLDINFLTAKRRFSIESKETSSRCTAQNMEHIKRATQNFEQPLKNNGPHKSKPTISKIEASLTCSSGRVV